MDYDKLISDRVRDVKFSGIRKFFDIAATVENVISLSIGEPDFKTPWNIRKEAIKALEKGKTTYTANSGLIQLRRAIADYTERKNGLKYDPDKEIVVTVGGSEAIDCAFRALLNPGDEVLIPEPSFVCYAPLVSIAGGTPVIVETKLENNFKLTAEEIKEKLTDKTKILVLPYPNNPTGAVMRRGELEKIAEVLRGTDVIVVSDEIYGELTYGDERHVSIAEIDGMQERTVLINGFSKAFSMTGWRMGYFAAPEPVAVQMLKIHQYGIMCSPTVSQYAAVAALLECDDDVQHMKEEYDARRRFVVKGFNELGLTCFEPEGAFYAFPCIKSTGMSSLEFCTKLLQAKKVAIVPGDAFGESGEGFVRVSYAYSLAHLNTALERIGEFLDELKKG
ncbi:MAG: aminotransferase class I/II-fold pyridoxal phosphate-dependent enzyme [Oscillospiraceae bacterium]|nr:aminotransferase class I/II-fold pyridoxal phosphate-dependent enzyme [Oscillospiraceae bacterium]